MQQSHLCTLDSGFAIVQCSPRSEFDHLPDGPAVRNANTVHAPGHCRVWSDIVRDKQSIGQTTGVQRTLRHFIFVLYQNNAFPAIIPIMGYAGNMPSMQKNVVRLSKSKDNGCDRDCVRAQR